MWFCSGVCLTSLLACSQGLLTFHDKTDVDKGVVVHMQSCEILAGQVENPVTEIFFQVMTRLTFFSQVHGWLIIYTRTNHIRRVGTETPTCIGITSHISTIAPLYLSHWKRIDLWRSRIQFTSPTSVVKPEVTGVFLSSNLAFTWCWCFYKYGYPTGHPSAFVCGCRKITLAVPGEWPPGGQW